MGVWKGGQCFWLWQLFARRPGVIIVIVMTSEQVYYFVLMMHEVLHLVIRLLSSFYLFSFLANASFPARSYTSARLLYISHRNDMSSFAYRSNYTIC
ncbi:hypothetical protein GGI35DRAFT_128502 [Trichoderma velutinum]